MLLLAAARAIAADAPSPPPPLEAYGQLPAIEQVEISPDGRLIALILTEGEERTVVVKQLADDAVIGALRAGDHKVRDLEWAGATHLIVSASTTMVSFGGLEPPSELLTALSYDVQSGEQRQLMKNIADAGNVLTGPPQIRTVDGQAMTFLPALHFDGEDGRISLYRIEESVRRTTLVQQGFPKTRGWLVDSTGALLAETEHDDRHLRWTLKFLRNGRWRAAKVIENAIDAPDVVGLGRDGHSALLAAYADNDRALREFAPNADDWDAPLAAGGVLTPIFDPVTHALVGIHQLLGDDDRYTFYSPSDTAAWQAIANAYPGQTPTLESWSSDRRRLVVHVDSPSDGPVYALVDLDARKAAWIGPSYPHVAKHVATVVPIAFTAADGLALTGYLTLPNDRAPAGLPLVVFPHGGPAARDTLGFDWWAQAMASRGYAVLQVNYRGSEGLGRDLLRAGDGQWGRKMQTDLSDGVRYLASRGEIDPKRVCIVGASYGGYAALAGATLDSAVYRCAAAIAGLSDLRRLVTWEENQHGRTGQMSLLGHLGAGRASDAALAEISPARHADRIVAPILLVHGKEDSVVPFEQTQIMADALKHAHKPYELVVLEHEDHWLSRGDTRLQMLRAVMDFLQRNNPAD